MSSLKHPADSSTSTEAGPHIWTHTPRRIPSERGVLSILAGEQR